MRMLPGCCYLYWKVDCEGGKASSVRSVSMLLSVFLGGEAQTSRTHTKREEDLTGHRLPIFSLTRISL